MTLRLILFDSVSESILTCEMTAAYGSQQRSHELIAFFAWNRLLDLKHAHGEARYHTEVFSQAFFDDRTEFVVVVKCANFWYFTQLFECRVVKLVYVADVRVLQRRIRQRLHVPESMCYPGLR